MSKESNMIDSGVTAGIHLAGKALENNTKADEIHALQNSADERLQKAGDYEAQNKLMESELKNAGLSILYKSLALFKKAGSKVSECISLYDDDTKKSVSEKVLRIHNKDIKITSLPILAAASEALVYAQEEYNLREMYANLIANTVDATKNTHPAYVEIIKQLTSEEASLLSLFMKDNPLPICCIRLITNDKGNYNELYRHLVNVFDGQNIDYFYQNNRFPEYIVNWIRLGLISVDYDVYISDDNAYNQFYKRPEFIAIQQKYSNLVEPVKLELQKGILERTEFGVGFAKAVGILE